MTKTDGVGRGRIGVLVLPVAFLAGCINSGSAPSLEDIREAQARAVQAVKDKGGTAETKNYPPGTGWVVSLSGATINDEDVEHLRAVGEIAELDLSGSTVTDRHLARLVEAEPSGGRPAAMLFRLNLSNTQVTDAGLKELAVLNLLSDLNVKGSKVTEAGIKEFEGSRQGKKLPYGLKLKIQK